MSEMNTQAANKAETNIQPQMSPKSPEPKKKIWKKVVLVIVAVLLIIGISAIVANIVHKKGSGDSVSASTKVENGLSAYELAVQYGYDGSMQDWLASLSGKSAYDIAVDNGYSGTEEEWISAIEAAADRDNESIKTAAFSEKGELLITLSDNTVLNLGRAIGADGKNGTNGLNGKDGINGANGQDGKDGQNGADGKNGADGINGIGITAANINTDGQLVLNFSDGQSVNLDKVVGMNGKDGVGVAKSEISESGELILTYSNGQSANLGTVVGANGKDGVDGKDGINGIDGKDGLNGTNGVDGINGTDGADGVSITNSSINTSGELILTYSDGKTVNLGVVIGSNGTNGVDGKDGENGINGIDGIGVTGAEINSNGELVLSYSNGQRSNLGNVIGANGKDGTNGIDGINGTDGKDGVNGVDGQDGISVIKSEINSKGELVLTYSDNTVSNLGVVIGADGKDGINGINGKDGENGKDGLNGADGKDGVGIESIDINSDNQLEITLTSGTKLNLGNIKGTDGINGTDGIGVAETAVNELGELVITYSDGHSVNLGKVVGKDGTNGIDGADGQDGIGVAKTVINENGELIITYSDGSSANLGKIVGSDGRDGVNGKDGINGVDGKDGTNGVDGQDGKGISAVAVTNGELVMTFSDNSSINLGSIKGADGKDGTNGVDGKDGADGKDGVNGSDGKDGIGISNVTISHEGALTVELTSGTVLNLGNIKGENGIGITKSEISADGELILTYTDGKTENLGAVVGRNGTNGTDGVNGQDGKDGVGIKSVTLSTDGNLSILMTDNSVTNLGNIKGEKGDTGAQGEKGDKGEPGRDGRGIASTQIVNGELIVTYTDGSTENAGKVTAYGYVDDPMATPELAYYPLNNGNYRVGVGNATAITDIVIPAYHNGKKVTSIATGGFTPNKSTMKSITIPNTITYFNESSINNAGTEKDIALRNVYYQGTIKDWVTKITFAYPRGWCCNPISGNSNGLFDSKYFFSPKFYVDGEFIEDIVIPEGVTKINANVFSDYLWAKSVVIPSSVSEIGDYALNTHTNMKVFYKGTVTEYNMIKKGDSWLSSKATVYYYSETKPVSSGQYWHYIENVPTAW